MFMADVCTGFHDAANYAESKGSGEVARFLHANLRNDVSQGLTVLSSNSALPIFSLCCLFLSSFVLLCNIGYKTTLTPFLVCPACCRSLISLPCAFLSTSWVMRKRRRFPVM